MEVQEVFFLTCVLASSASRRVEIWEYASPKPAIHVQCAQRIFPSFSAAIQGIAFSSSLLYQLTELIR